MWGNGKIFFSWSLSLKRLSQKKLWKQKSCKMALNLDVKIGAMVFTCIYFWIVCVTDPSMMHTYAHKYNLEHMCVLNLLPFVLRIHKQHILPPRLPFIFLQKHQDPKCFLSSYIIPQNVFMLLTLFSWNWFVIILLFFVRYDLFSCFMKYTFQKPN